MKVSFEEILKKAESYQKDMTKFLRDMVKIPSESCEERDVVLRIKEEMEKVGFDKVEIDPMGNVLGYIGHGKHLIAMDAHIDTVGIGEIKNWKFDPYEGFEDDIYIGGRGTSDQEGGMASMVYAGKIIKDLGLEDDWLKFGYKKEYLDAMRKPEFWEDEYNKVFEYDKKIKEMRGKEVK